DAVRCCEETRNRICAYPGAWYRVGETAEVEYPGRLRPPVQYLRKTGIEAERKGAAGPVQHLPQRQTRCDYLFRGKCLYVSPGAGCESNVRVPRLEVRHSAHLKFT